VSSWLAKHWRTIASGACGAGAVALGIFVNPTIGLAAGAVCTAAFGASATYAHDLAKRIANALPLTQAEKDRLGKL
jgi:hypothetical protein